jgi:hypothetical protein
VVDCSGLENLAGKAPETAETAELCGLGDAQEALFTGRSEGQDGTEVGTGLRDSWESQFVQATIRMALGKQRKPRPVELLAAEKGWTYFIQAHCGSIKIGRARNVEYRLKELQCANPHKLTLLAVALDGGREAEYHRRFAPHRTLGEWFEPHPDILAEIERLSPPESP